MIKSILTQIWNQRRSNSWLFAELLIVFVLLWYCLDMLYAFAYAERQPKGYDLEHVYKVRISTNPMQLVLCSSEDSLQNFWFKPMEEVSAGSNKIRMWRVPVSGLVLMLILETLYFRDTPQIA